MHLKNLRPLSGLILATLITCLTPHGFAQSPVAPNSTYAVVSQTEKEKIINKNLVAIDKGCVVASLIVKNKLTDKQNNKFNLLATFDELKTSQMAFIQKSTLSAYLVYLDAIEPTEINPTLMSSNYMLNCLSFVRH